MRVTRAVAAGKDRQGRGGLWVMICILGEGSWWESVPTSFSISPQAWEQE